MDRRKFLKTQAGLPRIGSFRQFVGSAQLEGKRLCRQPVTSNVQGDLHNHCNITYGHGDMRDACECDNWICQCHPLLCGGYSRADDPA